MPPRKTKPHRRRARGTGAVWERPDGYWVGAVALPPDPETGKRKRKYVFAHSQEDALDKLRDLQKAQSTDAADITVADWLRRHLDTVQALRAPGYWTACESISRLYLVPTLGGHTLAGLRTTHVQALLDTLSRQGLSPSRLKNIRDLIRAALNRAVDADIIVRNPAAHVQLPEARRPTIRPLDIAQVRTLLDGTAGTTDGALFALVLGTGLREGEALGLRWQDIDLPTGRIDVRQQLVRALVEKGESRRGQHRKELNLAPLKTASSRRTVYVPGFALVELRAEATRQTKRKADSPVFPNAAGTWQDPSAVLRRFKRTLLALDLPPQRFHDLRHAAAMLALESGAQLHEVQDLLGHSTLALTSSTYRHAHERQQQRTASRLDDLFSAHSEAEATDQATG